jgi:hypothetical protein
VPTGLGLRFAGRTAKPSKDVSKATTDKPLTPMGPTGDAQLMAINDSLVTEISLVHREKDALSLQLERSGRENNLLRTNLRLFSELPASNSRSMVPPHPTSSDSLSTVDEIDGQLVRGSATASSHKRSPNINQNPDGSVTRRARTHKSSASISHRNRATPDEPLAPLGPMGDTQLKETNRNLKSRLFILRREKNALRLQLEKSEREQDCLRWNLQLRMAGNHRLPPGDSARARAATFSQLPASMTKTMDPPALPSSDTLFKLDAIDGKFPSGSARAFSHGQCPNGDLLDSPPTWTHRSSSSPSPNNSLGNSTGFAPIENLPEIETGWAPRNDRPSSPGHSLVDFSEAMNPNGRSFALGLINASSSRAGLGNDRRRYASPSFHAGLGGRPSDYTAARASLGCVDLISSNASSTPRTATRIVTAAESGFEGHQLRLDENEGFCGHSVGHDQKAKCERLPDKE